jgi:hypothetical protein
MAGELSGFLGLNLLVQDLLSHGNETGKKRENQNREEGKKRRIFRFVMKPPLIQIIQPVMEQVLLQVDISMVQRFMLADNI